MNNFDLRKYLAEGRLKVNEGDMDHLMQDFEKELKNHDWFYYMSDDPRIYDRGTLEQRELKRLLKMLNHSQEAKDLYNKYAPTQGGIDLRIEEEKRPDYPDVDKDGDTEESMEKALKDRETSTVTNEGKSAKELETHIAALSKARAQAASSGKTTLLNSLHRDISKAQKELKKLLTKEPTTAVKEEYNVGKGMEKDHDFDAMLAHALKLHVGTKIEDLKKVAHDFEDVNYHREVAYLEDAIDMLEAGKHEEFEDSLKLFKDEVEKTIRSFNESIKEGDYDPDQEQLDDEDEIFMPMDDEGRPLEEALNPEVHRSVNTFIRKMADKYDIPLQHAVNNIMTVLRSQNYSGLNEDLDIGHEDNEPGMLKAELYHIGSYAMELYKMMDALEGQGEVDFPAWWQSKINTAKTMISGAKHYLEFELKEPAIDDMVDRLDGIAPEMEIDVVDDENMEESIDREFHSTSKTSGHPNWKDLSAVEIQDYIDANPKTLWGRSLRIAKMHLDQLKDAAVTEDTSLNDEAKAYFMGKVKRGEIDTLPEDPKAAFLAQMTKDQIEHDEETLDREGGLEEDSFYTDDIKNKVVSKLMDQLKK